MTNTKSSNYINLQRREYSLYVLQHRAIPAASDGLKAAARRVLWTARDGKKYKSATLAGATMPLHPHAAPESTINTLAAPYGNNIPLLHGDGAFGTLLNPAAYGAARYTSVKVSNFTKDVVFRDMEIIPMVENYDNTLMEPKHFLPLVPIALLNPSEGIAVGFASTILPRDLVSIIESQIQHLMGQKVDEMVPSFAPLDNTALEYEDRNGNIRWTFYGEFEKVNSTTVHVSKLPYGMSHEKFVDNLIKLEEVGTIVDFTDSSKDIIDVEIKFKRAVLDSLSDEKLFKQLNLSQSITENMNVLTFDGASIWSTNYVELIKEFCDWRLQFYVDRYQRLLDLIEKDIQKYKDIILAIKKNVGGLSRKMKSRAELKQLLEEFGIVYIDYIADLPVYRFTEEEKQKVENKLKQANLLRKEYKRLLSSEKERRMIYVNELKEVLTKYKKGNYNE